MPSQKKGADYWWGPVDPTPSAVTSKPTTQATPTGPRVLVIRPIRKAQQNDPLGYYVNCTSTEDDWKTKRDLSPFFLGPCKLYGGHVSVRMENAWQFSKVFPEHVGCNGNPTADYFTWAIEGWSLSKAERYPMGKGAKPEFHWWDGRKLTRVEARKEIYVPLYSEQVTKRKNRTFEDLQTRWLMMKHRKAGTLYVMDLDAYDYTGMTLTQVLNNPAESLGHGFVLAMLLTDDTALKECRLRSASK